MTCQQLSSGFGSSKMKFCSLSKMSESLRNRITHPLRNQVWVGNSVRNLLSTAIFGNKSPTQKESSTLCCTNTSCKPSSILRTLDMCHQLFPELLSTKKTRLSLQQRGLWFSATAWLYVLPQNSIAARKNFQQTSESLGQNKVAENHNMHRIQKKSGLVTKCSSDSDSFCSGFLVIFPARNNVRLFPPFQIIMLIFRIDRCDFGFP